MQQKCVVTTTTTTRPGQQLRSQVADRHSTFYTAAGTHRVNFNVRYNQSHSCLLHFCYVSPYTWQAKSEYNSRYAEELEWLCLEWRSQTSHIGNVTGYRCTACCKSSFLWYNFLCKYICCEICIEPVYTIAYSKLQLIISHLKSPHFSMFSKQNTSNPQC